MEESERVIRGSVTVRIEFFRVNSNDNLDQLFLVILIIKKTEQNIEETCQHVRTNITK